MKKNKSAILFLDKIKERNGGPSTYLYNLKKGLRELKIKDIIVISENQSVPFRFEKIWNKLEEKLYNNTISDYEMVLFEIIFILSEIKSKVYKRKKIKEACKYPLVQTHHVADMFYLSILGLYKGIKVLMMHSPEAWSSEVIHSLQDKFCTEKNFKIIWMYEHFIESCACLFADVFVFPSKEAEDTYLKYSFYRKNSKKKKVEYIITGSSLKKNRFQKNEVRKEFSLQQEMFVVLFIGRHNKVKGYDLLVKAQKELEKRKVCIVCAGIESKVYCPYKSEYWHELGWKKEVERLYDMADMVILPNKQTYFDLAAVEALSRGKILLASNTGGNRTLASGTKGVILFESGSVKDMIIKIENIQRLEQKERKSLENMNLSYYMDNCSIERFAYNYESLFKNLIGEYYKNE